MRQRFLFLVLFVALVSATGVFAKTSKASLVVTPAWLASHLHDPNLVLLHVGEEAGYKARHIAGARHVTLDHVSASDHSGKGLMLEMPPADDLRKRLEALGISDRSHVVVYYGKDWVSPSTRILFTLDHAGLGDHSSLLDGGMEAWLRAGHPVTDVVPEPRKGTLSPLKLRALVVDADTVKARLGKSGVAVIDGRSPAFYDGVDSGGSHGTPHKTGHIAGARSLPFSDIANEDLTLKTAAEWKELFTKAGVKPDDTIIGYCHIGQQATAMLFAARALGHPVLLYDGSFEDWSRKDYPVDNPAKKGSE